MRPAAQLQKVRSSYIRDILSAASAPGMLSLAGGLPPESGFPLHLLKGHFAGITARPELFQYGDSRGYAPLRDFLSELYGLTAGQDLLITSGSQQGLDLVARAFLNTGDSVVVEAPSYLGALQVFQLAGARLCPVQQTPAGPDLAQLERLFCEQHPRLFYAVPDFHNPTGCCWALETRQAVAALCRRHDVTLVEDAPYRELRFQGEDLPMVADFCPERALILRSTSKIAMPALRLASLSGPKAWLLPLEKVKQSTDLHSNVPLQATLLAVLSHREFAGHLAGLRQLYKRRYQALADALSQGHLTGQAVSGGMFLWVHLDDVNPAELAQRCLHRGVAVVPGSAFYSEEEQNISALRLNFTHLEEGLLRDAAGVILEEFHAARKERA